MNARISGLTNYKVLITPRVRYQMRGMLASKRVRGSDAPQHAFLGLERAFRYTRQKERLLCGVRLRMLWLLLGILLIMPH